MASCARKSSCRFFAMIVSSTDSMSANFSRAVDIPFSLRT